MSSIISDLFFGSKQNILDNYLINRYEAQPSSLQQKQQTVLYASFIQFVITIPSFKNSNGNSLLQVQVQMGQRSDEGFLEIQSGKKQSSSIILTLNELGKQDLNKYTNIKITISEGKYDKIHGFIPIESIKNIANSFSNEKTITIQMKGKTNFGFSSIQCTIKTQFPNNNVLNSEIMRSLQKDQSYQRSKEEFSEQVNQTYSSKQIKHNVNKQIIKNKKKQSNSYENYSKMKKKSQNIVIDDEESIKNVHKNQFLHQKITQFVKQVKQIAICFTKIQLGQPLIAGDEHIKLKLGQKIYKLKQILYIEHITRQGINIEILVGQKIIGFIHLGPLLLTLDKIYGQLPIFSTSQQCLGTIVIQSPNVKPQIVKKKPIIKPNQNDQSNKQQNQSKKQLLLLQLDKIIMINSTNSLNYSQDINTTQANLYDFTKMELNKIQVIVRITGKVDKFIDAVLNYSFDRQFIKCVQIRRKQGFKVQYFELLNQQNLNIEIQIFSAYRLICYCKSIIKANQTFTHKFIGGDTSSNIFHCGVYIKAIRLQVQTQYFQEHKINTIFNILHDILQKKVIINKLDDSQIKLIMNLHKKVTYVELKKLFSLIQKYKRQLHIFQSNSLRSVYSQEKPQINQHMIKIGGKLLEQFLYLDYNNQKMIAFDEFNKIIQFYKQDLYIALGKQCQQFINNPIKMHTKVIYLFFINGYYFMQPSSPIDKQINQPNEHIKQKHQSGAKKQQVNQITINTNEPKIQVEPSYFISKITINNAHILNLGKAPNTALNLVKKICYSNSNPQFIIQKQVSLLQNIKIYHKSIVQDRLILLAQFKPHRRQTYYELQASGKCFARIIWNL